MTASNRLRLFPLNTVLFPGAVLNLHVFEPRYRQMIAECLEGGSLRLCLVREGDESGDPNVMPHQVGTTTEIGDVTPFENGKTPRRRRAVALGRAYGRLPDPNKFRLPVEVIAKRRYIDPAEVQACVDALVDAGALAIVAAGNPNGKGPKDRAPVMAVRSPHTKEKTCGRNHARTAGAAD